MSLMLYFSSALNLHTFLHRATQSFFLNTLCWESYTKTFHIS